jgi:hypothetical protein
MITKVLFKKYSTFGLYYVFKDGLFIYRECNWYETKQNEKITGGSMFNVTYRKWTREEEDQIFNGIAQDKSPCEIIKEFIGNRTPTAIADKIKVMRKDIERMRGEIV